MKYKTFFVILMFFLVAGLVPTDSARAHNPFIKAQILNADQTIHSIFWHPSANQATGISAAVVDLGNDGIPEIVTGNGLGNEPRVRIMRQDGSVIHSFLAYAPNMGVGINVAVCDIDGDQDQEIITAPQKGGGPHVRIFTHEGEPIEHGFFAYAQNFREGVNLACGDLDHDGRAEIVTMPAAGGGPHVKIWKQDNLITRLHEEFFAFESNDLRGTVGAVHNNQLTIATQGASKTNIKTFVIHSLPRVINEKEIELETNGIASLFVHNNQIHLTTTSNGIIYNLETEEIISTENQSVQAISADFDNNGTDELLVVPSRPIFGEDEGDKSIVIDLSEQRIYAYENGVLANTFLISTGQYPYFTKVGKHEVLAKIPYVHYAWTYGIDDVRNYDLGLVQYNLRIYPHVYIHYAYWHYNFGHRMSHGCVNVNFENMKWIYEWAEEGIPVTVQE